MPAIYVVLLWCYCGATVVLLWCYCGATVLGGFGPGANQILPQVSSDAANGRRGSHYPSDPHGRNDSMKRAAHIPIAYDGHG